MFHIKFKYADALSGWQWREQECNVSSIDSCIKIYGLDKDDVKYEILKIEKIEKI
jgi:hypothetical protein